MNLSRLYLLRCRGLSYVLFELLVSFELTEIMILRSTLVSQMTIHKKLLSDYWGYFNCVEIYAWNMKSTVFDESSSLLPSFLIKEQF